MERTLCLIKPDGVRRGVVGQILERIERKGLKIIALKLTTPSADLAGQHYTYEDIAVRHGEAVRNALIKFLTSGPVVAFVVEGVSAIDNVRTLCGATEPLKAAPGTIRGDFAHHTFALTAAVGESVRNLIHASANAVDAARETALWFGPADYVTYRRADQNEHFLD
ncbi:MAG: nucleoside-diphosphate kinase [Spirochaetales bacterium]|nr:nucleoside-diphosphate kinase [Spirochaetales bacterium]